MEKTLPRPTARDLTISINNAIHEYTARHQDHRPDRIVMTADAYETIMHTVTVCYKNENVQLFGIPVVVEGGDGYHVHLAEPEIDIYAYPEPVPCLHLPPGYVPRED